MGYFDDYFGALVRNSFKTAPDGRRLFFPWGVMGRAYVIGSELDYERLRRQTKINLIIGLVLLIISELVLPRYFMGFVAVAVAAALIALNFASMRYLLRGLASPAERLSLQESETLQARGQSPVSLRWRIIGSIAFVALGVILLAIDPAGNWPLAAVTIIFFGFCAAVWTFRLVVRRGS